MIGIVFFEIFRLKIAKFSSQIVFARCTLIIQWTLSKFWGRKDES